MVVDAKNAQGSVQSKESVVKMRRCVSVWRYECISSYTCMQQFDLNTHIHIKRRTDAFVRLLECVYESMNPAYL